MIVIDTSLIVDFLLPVKDRHEKADEILKETGDFKSLCP